MEFPTPQLNLELYEILTTKFLTSKLDLAFILNYIKSLITILIEFSTPRLNLKFFNSKMYFNRISNSSIKIRIYKKLLTK
jgi:hypothetical protein